MSITHRTVSLARVSLALALLAVVATTTACADKTPPASEAPAEQASEPEQERAPVGDIKGWTVHINDDDSYTEGSVTYSIALNLTATNPSQDARGTYAGSATAKTDSTGDVNGQPLNASAIAESSLLEFTLDSPEGTDDALAPLTTQDQAYSGSGSIVMKAAGSGTIGQAGGGFENTSGQNVTVTTQGSEVTFEVDISGHTYTFEGTLAPEE